MTDSINASFLWARRFDRATVLLVVALAASLSGCTRGGAGPGQVAANARVGAALHLRPWVASEKKTAEGQTVGVPPGGAYRGTRSASAEGFEESSEPSGSVNRP